MTAYVGATVIDGTGRPPLGDATVLIADGVIRAVGRREDVTVPGGTRVVDVAGAYILPGLIDGHTHWRGWTGELFLNHGITSMVDLGNPTDWILAVKHASAAGDQRGPRVFTAAGALGARRDLREKGLFGDGELPPYVYQVAGEAETRATVRMLADRGADVIKIFSDLDPADILAATDEAHTAGLRVIGHSNDVIASMAGGMDGITHLWGICATVMTPDDRARHDRGEVACPYAWADLERMDDLISLLVERGAFVNPCLVNEHQAVLAQTEEFEREGYRLLMRPDLRYVPLTAVLSCLTFWHKVRNYDHRLGSFPYIASLDEERVAEFREGYRRAQEFVRRFAAAGGRVVAGTDAAGSASLPGLSLHQELELLVEAGLTEMQAIESATRVPAELVGQQQTVGTLEVGKRADLVVLAADPLADIRNTRRIDLVVQSGVEVALGYTRHFTSAFAEVSGIGLSSSTPPPPRLTGIAQVAVPGGGRILIARGAFHSTSVVTLDGRPLPTTFVSPAELRADLPSGLPAGAHPVVVHTPWPGGGASAARPFLEEAAP